MRFIAAVTSLFLSASAFAQDTCDDVVAKCKSAKKCESMSYFMVNGKPTVSPKAIATVKTNLDRIVAVAKLNHLDPRALIGMVLAANTVYRDVPGEKLLNRLPLGISTAVTSGPFYGIGKISLNSAMEVENSAYPKKWDPQPTSTRLRAEVHKVLQNDDAALMQMGRYLRYAQEVYEGGNWKISDRPEILATVLSVGKIEERVAETKKAGRVPKLNDWGALVSCNTDVIQRLLAESRYVDDTIAIAPAVPPARIAH